MLKVLNSLKIELIILYRSYWTWIALLGSIFYIGLGFYVYLFTLSDPGGALTSSAFVIQGGIFFSLILGISLVRMENRFSCDDVFYSIKNGFFFKMIAKSLLMLTSIFLIIVISITILYVMFFINSVPSIFYFKSLIYIILYWGFSFWICGITGMLLGTYIKSKLLYPISILVCLFVGPMNIGIFEYLAIAFKQDLRTVRDILNLGQSNPHEPYNPVYGLPMEIRRWLQKGLLAIIATSLFIIQTINKNFNKKPWFISFSVPFIIIITLPFFVGLFEKDQVLKTDKEKNSVRKYDYEYYSNKKIIEPRVESDIQIKSYEIDLEAFRQLSINVSMNIYLKNSLDRMVFTLYHDLKVNSIIIENKKVNFKQDEDFITVFLPEKFTSNTEINVIISYKGTSSPYFYANEQAVMLPCFFPWLPIEGMHSIMTFENSRHILNQTYNSNEAKYTLHYSGPKNMFSNIAQKNKNTWEGTTKNGITVVAGMMDKKVKGDKTFIYPYSQYKSIDNFIPQYVDSLNPVIIAINKDLNINIPEIKNIFVLSMPEEMSIIPSNVWLFDDSAIVGMDQHYNALDSTFLKYTNKTEQVLAAYLKSEIMLKQDTGIKDLFIISYRFSKNTDETNSTTPTFLFNMYQASADFYADNPEKKSEIETKSLVVKKLFNLIKKREKDTIFLNSFFKEWLEKMNQFEKFDWNKLKAFIEIKEAF